MDVIAGDKVMVNETLGGFTQQWVPAGAEGVVLRTSLGRADVCFTVPGLIGGTRTVEVSIFAGRLVKV